MDTQQFDSYAQFYDLLYRDKNYPKEAAYLHQLIRRFAGREASAVSLLDLACGTGKHLLELAKLGYSRLSGSDISAPMIKIAKDNTAADKKEIRFYNYSFQDADSIDQQFDIVLSMFSAINYLVSFTDQLKSFQNIYKLLHENGLFIFDYWNGNAVVRDYSPVKLLRKKEENKSIMRISTTDIDTVSQSVSVKFDCLYFEHDRLVDEFEEIHHLHYYHFSEMSNLLSMAGFDILHISPFMDPEKAIQPYDWNVSIVARRKPTL